MKSRTLPYALLPMSALLLSVCLPVRAESQAVNQPARQVPIAYQVDVAVVGGGVGAVSAAVEAAQAGATVFLAAPRPYLGDDMAGLLRLWLEEGEKPVGPLAEQLYNDPIQGQIGPDPDAIPFTYEASLPPARAHQDSTPPTLLGDGKWSDASSESVQYDGEVVLTVDLGASKPVKEARLMAYHRDSGQSPGNFVVSRVEVSVSDDKQAWTAIGSAERTSTDAVSALAVEVGRPTRYLKLEVRKPENEARVLLGEIEIVGTTSEPKPAQVSAPRPPRPMHVKRTLDNALLAAGVKYLYGCQPTEVLVDKAGRIGGLVMSNRAGRQAVLARVIIDATDRGHVARLAGASFQPFQPGNCVFRRVVIGGEPCAADNMTARILPQPYVGPYPNPAKTSSNKFSLIEYTLELPMADDSPASWAAADQQARNLTYHSEQQYTSDGLFHVPTDPMLARAAGQGDWAGVESLALDSFRPRGIDGLYVLGGTAQLSPQQAERLLRPVSLLAMGGRIGKAAAAEAAATSQPQGLSVRVEPARQDAPQFDVGEFLNGTRPIDQGLATVNQPAGSLPVLGRYDVVVIGGGTTGAPAGIGAARQGARTLVVEYLHELGGVGTTGAISNYYWGNRIGFSATVEDGKKTWIPQQRIEWWRRQILDAGADIWFGTVGCGAVVDGKQLRGVVVASTWGRGVVLADVVVDTTGNSDIAAAAGAQVDYTDHRELAMQGTGLPGTRLGGTYNNTDFTITDETDMVDVWQMFVFSKDKYPEAFDHGKLIDTRERRRVVGDFSMSLLDQFNLRTYPDTIQIAYSNFDSHGYTVDPYLELNHPEKVGVYVNVPYRCCLPKGLEGILVGGLGMSVDRDAVPLTRMQPDLQNQGYALGAAAAMVTRSGAGVRQLDVRQLQQHLIAIGNLPQEVLEQKDSYPIPTAEVAAAVQSLPAKPEAASIVLARPDAALPLLRKAFQAAEPADKLAYAHALAILGDGTGLDVLIDKVAGCDAWDEGWDYRGMGQFGSALSPLDRWIVALGRVGNPRAIDTIVQKAKLLNAQSEFSHHRAVGLALELIGDPQAAEPLAQLLTQPAMSGYVVYTIEDARAADQKSPGGTNAVQSRRDSIRELALARALFRCGDYGSIGQQVLTEYTKDLRGHFSRHAKAVLDQAKP
ncbi:MAG: FAD-dependent oxidoreductase [Thermoguttaceae bacterium]